MASNQAVCGSTQVEQPTPVTIEMNSLQASIGSIENKVQVLSERLRRIMSDPCPPENEKQPTLQDVTCEASRVIRESSERVTVVADILQDMITRCQL